MRLVQIDTVAKPAPVAERSTTWSVWQFCFRAKPGVRVLSHCSGADDGSERRLAQAMLDQQMPVLLEVEPIRPVEVDVREVCGSDPAKPNVLYRQA